MTKLSITVVSWDDFISKFCSDEMQETLFVPVQAFDDITKIKSGTPFELQISLLRDHQQSSLVGTVEWVRNKPIKLPGKFISAGVSIALDAKSRAQLSSVVVTDGSSLEEMNDEEMVGGNYIKIRKDIAEKYRKKNIKPVTPVHSKDNRKQPRIQIKFAVDLFIKDNLHNLISRDISLGGMSVETDELFDIGEEVLMVFEDKEMAKTFVIKGHIVRHIPSTDTSLKGIGLKFDFENINQRKMLLAFIVRKS